MYINLNLIKSHHPYPLLLLIHIICEYIMNLSTNVVRKNNHIGEKSALCSYAVKLVIKTDSVKIKLVTHSTT